MRLHFREKPRDLQIALFYATVIGAVLLYLNVEDLAAILLLAIVPGYVLVAALFPGGITPDNAAGPVWIERIALSSGLGIAAVSLFGLVLTFTPWGIRVAPAILTILAFTAGVGFLAYRRRVGLPADYRLSLTLNLSLPVWKEYRLLDKGLTITLAASLVVAAGTLVYVFLTPRTGETFTEFYILGPGGSATGYPTRLNVSEPGTVILGVVNHESATVNYTVRVDLVGVTIVYNSTGNYNETAEVNRTTWSWFNVSLADGGNWTQRYVFSIPSAGFWKVQFLLYEEAVLTNQRLHLFIRVS